MTLQGWALILGFVAILLALTKPVGAWLFALYEGGARPCMSFSALSSAASTRWRG